MVVIGWSVRQPRDVWRKRVREEERISERDGWTGAM